MKSFLNRDYVENFVKYHKKTIIKAIAGIVLFAVAFFAFCIRDSEEDGEKFNLVDGVDSQMENTTQTALNVKDDTSSTEEKKVEEKNIYVDISGAVNKPYVYELKSGARVYEAIEMAGGMTAEADASNLNLALVLSDQDKITVLTKKQTAAGMNNEGSTDNRSSGVTNRNSTANSGASEVSQGLININTATETELQTITGIGPSTAEKIVSYRNDHGEFKKIEEIMNVSGIGEKTFAKYKNKITV